VAKLIYSAITSLDGFVADDDGNFDWAEPDEEVHAYFNELERPVGTYLYGRRMYEVMSSRGTPDALTDQPPTSITCSSRRSSWAAASQPCPTMLAWNSTCRTCAASATASCSSATRSRRAGRCPK
jgi:dihydrofolate reductase